MADHSDLDDLAREFTAAAVEYVQGLFGVLAEAKMEGDPALTDRLAKSRRLPDMKGDVRDLEDETPASLGKRLDEAARWWHRRAGGRAAGGQDRAQLEDAIRMELGKLARIFARYGYIGSRAGTFDQWDSKGGFRSHRGDMRFEGPLTWTDRMESALARYDEVARSVGDVSGDTG